MTMTNSIRSPGRAICATHTPQAAECLPDSGLPQWLATLPVACLVLARDGCVWQANPLAWQLLRGQPAAPPEASPVGLQRYLTEDTQPHFADFLRQCLVATAGARCEVQVQPVIVTPEDSVCRWLRLEGRLDTQVSLTPGTTCITVIAYDISADRVAAQAALETQQQLDFYTNLCARIPGILFQYQLNPDGSTCFPYVSDAIPRMYGVSQAQARENAGSLASLVHPDDLPSMQASMQTSAETMQIWRQEYRMTLPEGGVIWRALEANPEKRADGSVLWHGYTIDITERKRLQKAVEQSAAHCKLVIEAVGDGVWDWDVANDVFSYSSRWKNILGYADHEIGNHSAEGRKRVHPDDLAIVDANRQTLLDGVTDHTSVEVRLCDRNGDWRWMLTRSAVVARDKTGRPLQIVGTNVDITEHRKLEEAVRESEQRWKLALAAVGYAVWEWDLVTDKSIYSPQWKAMLGYAADEIEGDASGWASRLHPDDQAIIYESFRSLIAHERPYDSLEFRLRGKNGEWKWVLGSGILVEQTGQSPRIVGGIIDIDKRKRIEEDLRRSEERWKFALEGGGDGVWDWDISTNKIEFSLRYAQILGLSEGDVVHDYDEWCKRVHPDDFEKGTQNRRQHIQRGIDASSVELRVRHGAGHWVWILSRGLVVKRDAQGQPLRLVGAISDITVRKREEEHLQQLLQEIEERRREAEQMAMAKTNFLSAASHDLRQPLYAAQLFVDSFVQQSLAPAQRQVADSLQLAIKSMSAQLDALLEISRFDMGRLEASKRDISIAQFLQELEITYAPIARKASVTLVFRALEGRVHTDPVLLGRLLGNLIDNAIKFAVKGRVLVCVRRSQTGFRVEVRDNGPGIDAEYQHKIFDEYFQVGNAARDAKVGLGLGLAIVQRVASLLELKLQLRTKPDWGAVFSIFLPAANGNARSRRRRRKG